MSNTDEELIRKAVSGDTAALEELLNRHAAAVRQRLVIDRKWSNVLDVDDVMQVTFMEAFLHIHKFDPGNAIAFTAWLRRIAENNLRDAVKELERQKRPQPEQRVVPSNRDESAAAFIEQLGVTHSTPSRSAAGHEMLSALHAALGALPGDYADVVRLYDLECRPIAEVAATMKRSAGAVHMLRSRAYDQLRELLGPESNFITRAT